jgi:glycosyltransferase involved in cell wall biosynthesis/SAM-dependent methyltransferase
MRLAYFSPLPPGKSGIADYSAELLPYLARGAEISVFVEHASELKASQGRTDYAVYDVVHFDGIHRQQPFDLCLYHQGNNPYHEYIYERALKMPGLLVLHEHCQHHLIAWKTLGREDEEAYHEEMFHACGRRGSRLAEMRASGVGSDYQQFLLPLNRRLIESSLGVIVHNAYAASQLEAPSDGRDIPVAIIPHHLSPKVYALDQMDGAECRRALRLPEESWIVATFGFVTQSKRIPALLRAFKKLLAVVPQALCLIVGEDHWKWSVAPLIEQPGLQESVRLTGYTKEEDFFRYLKAVDAVVNLRYPTAGETSGTLIRALGAGKPVIVSDFGQFGDLPDEICLKVSPGENEEKELYAQLRKLAYRPTLREALSRNARQWIRAECDISRCAARYLAFAESLLSAPGVRVLHFPIDSEDQENRIVEHKTDAQPGLRPDPDEAIDYVAGFFTDDPQASGYLKLHRGRILETVSLIPQGRGKERLLELSSYLHLPPLVRRYGHYADIALTGWWEGETREIIQRLRHSATGGELSFPMQNVDAERDRFPYPDNYFDVALCCEIIEHLTADPMHMLIELSRVLKWGGRVILTTPNIASAFSIGKALSGNSPYVYGEYNLKSRADRHSREYTPNDVRIALEAAGFKVERLYTKDLWCKTDEPFVDWLVKTTGVPRELRGDNIFAVGRKASTQIERYPDGLYD